MELYDLKSMTREESARSPLSVALGNFDGVHKGHAALIKHAVLYARQCNIKSAVWTFADGDAVLPNKPGTPALTTMREKLSLFRELGVDYVFLENFEAVRDFSPEKFVKEVLIQGAGAVCAVCGFNFRFGARGTGDSSALRRLMEPFKTIVVPPVYVEEQLVSSSAVRAFVEVGDMEGAEKLLGHSFSVCLPVVTGKQLGRTIGIPTINQNFPDGHIVPKRGIYACKATVGGKVYDAVTNVGTRPSVDGDSQSVNCETHIIGYEGDLYGEYVRVSFIHRLRDEMKFASVDELRCAIEGDIAAAREYFSK